MKTVILAGGLGTRLAEETDATPKPMVEIGGSPILWHIMKIYSSAGFSEFVLALGYRAEVVKRYFLDYYRLRNDLTITGDGKVEVHDGSREDWRIDLVDTGIDTQTGGRIKRLADRLRDGTFMLTYGDLVSDFVEKPQIGEGWINGGFFVLEPGVLDYIDGDDTIWERDPLERLAQEGQLAAFRHEGFWQPMDTLRDVRLLRTLWESGDTPWKVWE